MRDIVAVVVTTDSPAGHVTEVIDELPAHLSVPQEPRACPLCSTQSWPCARFDAAAHRVQAAGLRLGELVPVDRRAARRDPDPTCCPPPT